MSSNVDLMNHQIIPLQQFRERSQLRVFRNRGIGCTLFGATALVTSAGLAACAALGALSVPESLSGVISLLTVGSCTVSITPFLVIAAAVVFLGATCLLIGIAAWIKHQDSWVKRLGAHNLPP